MESLHLTAPCFARMAKAAAQYNEQQGVVPRFLLIGRVCEGRGEAREIIGLPSHEKGPVSGEALERLKPLVPQLYPGMSVIGWASTSLGDAGDTEVWAEVAQRLRVRQQYVFKMRVYTHEEMPATEAFLMSPGSKAEKKSAEGPEGRPAEGAETQAEPAPVTKPIAHQIVISDSDAAVMSKFFEGSTNVGQGGVAYVAQKLVDAGDHAAAEELAQGLTSELVRTLRERLSGLQAEVDAALRQQYPSLSAEAAAEAGGEPAAKPEAEGEAAQEEK